MVDIEIGVSGRYILRRMKDGEVLQELEFSNLVLDGGLSMLAGTSAVYPWAFCRVGTGSSPESASQTALDSQAGSISGVSARGLNTTDRYLYIRLTYTWGVGAVTGNLSEVGVGTAATGNTLFSRALIKDMMGAPTTITVLSDEQLQVVYELRLYQPAGDMFTGSVGGYACTMRASLDTSDTAWKFDGSASVLNAFGAQPLASYMYYDGVIGASSGSPSGASATLVASGASFTSTPVSPGVVDVFFRAPVGTANFAGGVRSVKLNAGPGTFQCQFDPAIPKTNTDRLDLTFRFSVTRRP